MLSCNSKKPRLFRKKSRRLSLRSKLTIKQARCRHSASNLLRKWDGRFSQMINFAFWQVRPGGFTFSRLAPYQSWEPFRDEARRLWEITRTVVKPGTYTRVALRYVNRLELPLPFSDFKEYLLTVPEVAPTLPQALSTFFMQLQIPQVDIQAMLILNQQLLPQVLQGTQPVVAPVLLDIDLFKEIDLPQNEEGMWNLLETLHFKKNATFEGCITDKTRALIR